MLCTRPFFIVVFLLFSFDCPDPPTHTHTSQCRKQVRVSVQSALQQRCVDQHCANLGHASTDVCVADDQPRIAGGPRGMPRSGDDVSSAVVVFETEGGGVGESFKNDERKV